jgi:hypothetical protein
MKKKIFVNNFGHYNPLTLNEFTDYLRIVFNKFNITLRATNSFNNEAINIVFEGHHPSYRERVLEILNNSSNLKKGIVLTEILYGSNFLNEKYFTFNNRTLNKNIKNELFSFFYLIYLNFTFYFIRLLKKFLWDDFQKSKYEKKKNLKNRIYNKIFHLIFDELDNPNGIYYWKERYNFFYSIVKKFDFIVNITGDEKQYYKKFKNVFKIDFLSTGKKINRHINSKDKKIDCLFTGQLTSYRKELLSNLKAAEIEVKYYDYLEIQKREEIFNNTKIYLCLKKFQDDNLPLGTRVWHCLENSIFFITEKNDVKKNFLEHYALKIDNHNFVEKVKEILNNYNIYVKYYFHILKKYRKNIFYRNNEIINFVNYIKNC